MLIRNPGFQCKADDGVVQAYLEYQHAESVIAEKQRQGGKKMDEGHRSACLKQSSARTDHACKGRIRPFIVAGAHISKIHLSTQACAQAWRGKARRILVVRVECIVDGEPHRQPF